MISIKTPWIFNRTRLSGWKLACMYVPGTSITTTSRPPHASMTNMVKMDFSCIFWSSLKAVIAFSLCFLMLLWADIRVKIACIVVWYVSHPLLLKLLSFVDTKKLQLLVLARKSDPQMDSTSSVDQNVTTFFTYKSRIRMSRSDIISAVASVDGV